MKLKILKKIGRKLFNLLPEDKRIAVIRKLIKVPSFAFSEKFTVKLAETGSEFEAAYHLLYESYLNIGIISEHQSRLRCTPFSMLPETATVIVLYEERVVGTVSLIMDSVFGLPSDHSYGLQNDLLRKGDHKLCEVSALAVEKEFRAMGHSVSLLLMKYLYNYCRQAEASHLVCSLHPRAKDFYKAFWDFKNDGPDIDYDYVDAPATHMYTELTDEHQHRVISFFKTQSPKYNPGYFAIHHDPRFFYPDLSEGKIFRPTMQPDLLEYFFLKKTDMFESLTSQQQSVFFNIYLHYFEESELSAFLQNQKRKAERRLQYRVPVQIPCSLKVKNENIYKMAVIRDLSEQGAFVHFLSLEELSLKFETIQFTLQGTKFNLTVNEKWLNTSASFRMGKGLGVHFGALDVRLAPILVQFPQIHGSLLKKPLLKAN